MPCYHPVDAWRGAVSPSTGKAKLVFKRPDGRFVPELQVPCGRCIGCRLEYSRQWAVRIMHEASMHEDNCFITLTYDDAHVPVNGSLDVREWQLFAKRLRKNFGAFRFFHCGEYGEQFSRPHYHACLFGVDFPDKVLFREGDFGDLYTSQILEDNWKQGFCTVGSLTFESAAYVARYVTKKVTGDDADEHYMRMSEYGQVYRVEPEYCTMSRGEGIGRSWFDVYGEDVYPHDEVIVRGASCKPPRYYDTLHAERDYMGHLRVRAERAEASDARASEGTPERLRVREAVRLSRIKTLQRKL